MGPPEDEVERDEAYLHIFFTQEIQMLFGLNLHLIGRLRESGDWSAEALMANLRLADDELAAASESGIRAFEAGDSWTACHVLIPQFERGLRKVAVTLSAHVRRLVADQGIQFATLGPILADDAMIGFLGANLAQTLVAVFTEPRGLNARNTVAHGLLDPDEGFDRYGSTRGRGRPDSWLRPLPASASGRGPRRWRERRGDRFHGLTSDLPHVTPELSRRPSSLLA